MAAHAQAQLRSRSSHCRTVYTVSGPPAAAWRQDRAPAAGSSCPCPAPPTSFKPSLLSACPNRPHLLLSPCQPRHSSPLRQASPHLPSPTSFLSLRRPLIHQRHPPELHLRRVVADIQYDGSRLVQGCRMGAARYARHRIRDRPPAAESSPRVALGCRQLVPRCLAAALPLPRAALPRRHTAVASG